jgi:hypothetical protein
VGRPTKTFIKTEPTIIGILSFVRGFGYAFLTILSAHNRPALSRNAIATGFGRLHACLESVGQLLMSAASTLPPSIISSIIIWRMCATHVQCHDTNRGPTCFDPVTATDVASIICMLSESSDEPRFDHTEVASGAACR